MPQILLNDAKLDHKLKIDFERALVAPADEPASLDKQYVGASSTQARTFPITPSFELSPYQDGHIWRLSIVTADRKGLLFNLARVFVHHQIDLKSAKIMTLGERVEDSFLLQSERLHNAAILRQFERQISDAI
ncbi:hypothetical protein L1889_05855 [Paenalcaligenes niemegkensis]|nr:hypothetical protein [Paenalcaligenes niemegkensis]MCQ9616281.1 hypothetical protein [Paenalcaligenes niemegkensis]